MLMRRSKQLLKKLITLSITCRNKISHDNVVKNIGEIFTMMALNTVWQIGAGERL